MASIPEQNKNQRQFNFILNPLRVLKFVGSIAPVFTGGYLNSSPSAFMFFATLKECDFITVGVNPWKMNDSSNPEIVER